MAVTTRRPRPRPGCAASGCDQDPLTIARLAAVHDASRPL